MNVASLGWMAGVYVGALLTYTGLKKARLAQDGGLLGDGAAPPSPMRYVWLALVVIAAVGLGVTQHRLATLAVNAAMGAALGVVLGSTPLWWPWVARLRRFFPTPTHVVILGIVLVGLLALGSVAVSWR
jgi:hypothetical protein